MLIGRRAPQQVLDAHVPRLRGIDGAVDEIGQKKVRAILSALGAEEYVTHENELDMATALSGTGPAFVFMFMEALVDAGVHMGFSRRVAEKLVFETVLGATENDQIHFFYHFLEKRNGGKTEEVFQQQLDQVRSELAITYLQEPGFSLTDIGELLGFAESGVFTRSFRRWFGVTPSRWRARQFG